MQTPIAPSLAGDLHRYYRHVSTNHTIYLSNSEHSPAGLPISKAIKHITTCAGSLQRTSSAFPREFWRRLLSPYIYRNSLKTQSDKYLIFPRARVRGKLLGGVYVSEDFFHQYRRSKHTVYETYSGEMVGKCSVRVVDKSQEF